MLQVLLLVLPPIVYVITKRWCLALQHNDEELLHHGIESGTIRRLPSGEFVEETVPLPVPHRIALTRVEPDHAAITDGSNPGGPGYGEVEVVESEPEKVKGFFRAKHASGDPSSTALPRPEAAALQPSGKPAKPE